MGESDAAAPYITMFMALGMILTTVTYAHVMQQIPHGGTH